MIRGLKRPLRLVMYALVDCGDACAGGLEKLWGGMEWPFALAFTVIVLDVGFWVVLLILTASGVVNAQHARAFCF